MPTLETAAAEWWNGPRRTSGLFYSWGQWLVQTADCLNVLACLPLMPNDGVFGSLDYLYWPGGPILILNVLSFSEICFTRSAPLPHNAIYRLSWVQQIHVIRVVKLKFDIYGNPSCIVMCVGHCPAALCCWPPSSDRRSSMSVLIKQTYFSFLSPLLYGRGGVSQKREREGERAITSGVQDLRI